MTTTVQEIPTSAIAPDPGQPRKTFDAKAIRELAASIKSEGLLQPITIRPDPLGHGFLIVAGERRWRAHEFNRAPFVRAIVRTPVDLAEVRVLQIVENDQRVDVTPLEQARSYQGLMDQEGWTVDQLSARIGKAPHRIKERTDLLRLQPEYQALLESGNLKPSEATELVRLDGRGQQILFNAIRTGKAKDYNSLRAMATALLDAQAQMSLISDEPAGPSEEERRTASGFETAVERLSLLLRSGIKDNDIVAVRKVDPNKASHYAELFGAMQKDMRRIELALRSMAVQAELMA